MDVKRNQLIKKIEKGRIFVSLSEEEKTISPRKEDTVLMLKHDECVSQSIAPF